jgi:hypothetical protein
MLEREGPGEGDEGGLRELRFRWSVLSGDGAMFSYERITGSQSVAHRARL